MIRFALYSLAVVCTALVAAEGIALGLLAQRGQLNRETAGVIVAAFAGETPAAAVEAPAEAAPTTSPTAQDRRDEETFQSLELKEQADELRLLAELIAARTSGLERDRAAFEAKRTEFERRLAELRARTDDAATEQTRAVLKALPPEETVTFLSPLPEEDAVRLLRGLPEKTTAKILQAFAAGADEERRRGRALFEAISAGRPESDLIRSAAAPATPPG